MCSEMATLASYGLNNNAAQQILNTDLGIHVDEHFGAFHTPGFFTDVDLVSQFKIAIDNLFDGYVGSHNFGQTGRRQGLISIFFYQNLTRLRVQQHKLVAAISGARGMMTCAIATDGDANRTTLQNKRIMNG